MSILTVYYQLTVLPSVLSHQSTIIIISSSSRRLMLLGYRRARPSLMRTITVALWRHTLNRKCQWFVMKDHQLTHYKWLTSLQHDLLTTRTCQSGATSTGKQPMIRSLLISIEHSRCLLSSPSWSNGLMSCATKFNKCYNKIKQHLFYCTWNQACNKIKQNIHFIAAFILFYCTWNHTSIIELLVQYTSVVLSIFSAHFVQLLWCYSTCRPMTLLK